MTLAEKKLVSRQCFQRVATDSNTRIVYYVCRLHCDVKYGISLEACRPCDTADLMWYEASVEQSPTYETTKRDTTFHIMV